MATTPVIRTRNVARLFERRAAVRDLTLSVDQGQVYAFVGPNGAGKTTTIRMLLGLLRPSAGEIALFGETFDTGRQSILRRTGSLVEQPSLYGHLTARENLDIHRRILNTPRSEIDRVLALAGLQDAEGKLVRHFSTGMKQRLGLALALLGDRELIILDEPANGLDPAGIHEMRTIIRNLPSQHGVTVFLSSHLLGEVEQIASHVGILSQGTLVFQGTIADVSAFSHPRLAIVVNNAHAACEVLRRRGWPVEESGGVLTSRAIDAAPQLNRALVEAGFDVHRLSVEAATLEDVFLEMTAKDSS